MPVIQPSLKIQTITQCQVYGYIGFFEVLDFKLLWPMNNNCYWHLTWPKTLCHHFDYMTSKKSNSDKIKEKYEVLKKYVSEKPIPKSQVKPEL